ncbi:MAG: DoxX family protein [Verrucomicrobiota bacterium]
MTGLDRLSLMPFQPLPDTGPGKPTPSDFGLFVIRFLVAVIFFYYELKDLLTGAFRHVWEKAEWPLSDLLEERGLPFPEFIAAAFLLVLTLALIGIAIGIFTRVNSILLLLLFGLVLFLPLELSPSLNPQAISLYLVVFLGLALGGAGRASLDHALSGRKKKKKS